MLDRPLEDWYNSILFCSEHFERNMFADDNMETLLSQAVPTLFDAAPRLNKVYRLKSTPSFTSWINPSCELKCLECKAKFGEKMSLTSHIRLKHYMEVHHYLRKYEEQRSLLTFICTICDPMGSQIAWDRESIEVHAKKNHDLTLHQMYEKECGRPRVINQHTKKSTAPTADFSDLIAKAINNSDEKMLRLSDIYTYISTVCSKLSIKFKADKSIWFKGWEDCVKRNLSVNTKFQTAPGRSEGEESYWMIKDEEHDIMEAESTVSKNMEAEELSDMYEVDVKIEPTDLPNEEQDKDRKYDLPSASHLKPRKCLLPRSRKLKYHQLIEEAINRSDQKMLQLSDIYAYISKEHSQYRMEDQGWQNSIRHNLSLRKKFQKVARHQREGRGNYWTIVTDSETEQFDSAISQIDSAISQIVNDEPQNVKEGYTEGTPTKSPDCGKTFKSKTGLTYNLTMHTGELPFKCPDCGNAFSNEESLNQHWNLTHIRPLRAYTKAYTRKEIVAVGAQKSKVNDTAASRQGEYKCPKCGSAFERVAIIGQQGNRTYRGTCAKCTMEVHWSSDIYEHIITETVSRPIAGTSKAVHVGSCLCLECCRGRRRQTSASATRGGGGEDDAEFELKGIEEEGGTSDIIEIDVKTEPSDGETGDAILGP